MKKIITVIISVISVIIIAVITGISIYNTSANRINRHLDLGQKYLEEQNYGLALVEFDKVIDIDPINVDAYIGKVQVYESTGEIDMLIQVLEEAYEKTDSRRIEDSLIHTYTEQAQNLISETHYEEALNTYDRLLEIDKNNYEIQSGLGELLQEYIKSLEEQQRYGEIQILEKRYADDANVIDFQKEFKQADETENMQVDKDAIISEINNKRVEKLQQFLNEKINENEYNIMGMCICYVNPYVGGYYGPDEQIESICNPLVSAIEEYIELTGKEGVEQYGSYLAWFYYVLDEYEKCIQARKQIYEMTGNVEYSTEEYTIEEAERGVVCTYNQYGMILNISGNGEDVHYYYGDNGRLSHMKSVIERDTDSANGNENIFTTFQYEYDTDGKLIKEVYNRTFSDGSWCMFEEKYQCMDNRVIVYYHEEDSVSGIYDRHDEYEINQYGICES